jgi:flagellar protein FlaG
MHPQQQPAKIQLTNTADYREAYANSVQVRVSLWDFFLSFGTIHQSTPDAVNITNFQGIFLSPQQAKALANVLNQNITQYEAAFGEIRLEPKQPGSAIQ